MFAGSGAAHLRLVDRAGMRARTLTLGSAGKLFALTGWRVGWVGAAENKLTKIPSAVAQLVNLVCVLP